MIIGVAGPYSAPTESERKRNLAALNSAAMSLYKKGHIPLIGVNAALPVVENYDGTDRYELIMAISMAVIDKCDALLMIGESPGANRERDLIAAKGLPIFFDIGEVPDAA